MANDTSKAARFLLARLYFANWVYNNILVGTSTDEGIVEFSGVSQEIFNDRLFYDAAFTHVTEICPIEYVDEMFTDRVLYLDKQPLRNCKNLSEEGMKEAIKGGEMSLFSYMIKKKLAENVVFEEEVIPMSYTSIDGSDSKSSTSSTVPVSLIFSLDADTLNNIFNLFDLENKQIVKDSITELQKDEKFQCFAGTLSLVQKLENL